LVADTVELAVKEPRLSNEQLDRFDENGFLVLTDFVPPAELKTCRERLLRLFADRAGYDRGVLYDFVSSKGEPDRIPSLNYPSNFDRSLRDSVVHKAALAVARRVLGPEARPSFEYAILKHSKGGPTPWHQDEAFKKNVSVGQRELTIWIPMQPATVENGCLRYIAGSNKEALLNHFTPEDDPTSHALLCTPDDLSRTVYAPVPLGGCVMHDMRTIHGGGPNESDGERLAYILLFDTPGTGPAAETFSWLKDKKDPAHERHTEWLRRGGWIAEGFRMLRRGELTWPRVRDALARVINLLKR
jgi:ectoine hydroxylase-related dioxygenase (phytanoyl-CoA dioxygenase family)